MSSAGQRLASVWPVCCLKGHHTAARVALGEAFSHVGSVVAHAASEGGSEVGSGGEEGTCQGT